MNKTNKTLLLTKSHIEKIYVEVFGNKATAKTKYNKIANDIINGKYGNGEKRFTNLKNANYDYTYAQMLVNNILKG